MILNRKTAWEAYLAEAEGLAFPAGLPDTVINGSFEDGNSDEPIGWHLVSGSFGESTAWCTEGGVDGGRCLRISPEGGGASWYSNPIPIMGGVEYLFRCAVRREGKRHWAHACAVNWVSLVFRDASGRPIRKDPEQDQPLLLMRTRKTDGWVDGWRHLRAPDDATHLEIGFRITRGEPDLDDPNGFKRFWHAEIDTGHWWIDDVRLERMPLETSSGQGTLCLHIPGGEARVRIATPQGETFSPPNSIAYASQGGCFHSLREDVHVALRPGSYHVEAMRGFQRIPFSQEAEVVEGRDTRLTVELPRVADWPAHGWYTGDHHNHLSFHGETRHPLMTIDDVCRVARGEGLDYLSFCGEIVDQHAYAEWRESGMPDDARPDGAFETGDFVCSVSHEVTHDVLGHVCLVNAPGRVSPGHPWWLAPTNGQLALGVRRSDAQKTAGAVVMAHPYHGMNRQNLLQALADPETTCLYRELPVDVALGFADTMDFLSVEPPEDLEQRFEDYFRLLNLGLRVGVSGASDAYADQGTEIVGSLVTLVYTDRLHMNSVARAYEAQRTMTSNGPLLRFRAGGREIGSTVQGPVVEVEAKAYSNWGLTRLEIIANGEIVADATPDEEGWARIRQEVRVERSGWMIARAWGPGHPYLNLLPVHPDRRAHEGQWVVTSPIYVEVAGKPLAPRPEDIDYFLRWLDACRTAIAGRRSVLEVLGPHGPDMREEDVKRAMDLFRRARERFEEL